MQKLKEMGYEDELPKLRAWHREYLDKYIDRDTELTARGTWIVLHGDDNVADAQIVQVGHSWCKMYKSTWTS